MDTKSRSILSDRGTAGAHPPESASVNAYEQIKKRILTGRLRSGEQLPDRRLGEEFGVSRTPVREALGRLEKDGLVTRNHRGGYAVAEMNSTQIAELYDLREAIEVHAFLKSCAGDVLPTVKAMESVLEKLREMAAKNMRMDEITLSMEIHKLLVGSTGNKLLYETFCNLLNRMQFFIWMETIAENEAETSLSRREHEDIVSYLKGSESEKGVALVRRHIRTASSHILRVVRSRENSPTKEIEK